MPWCPTCKTEYNENIQTCYDCGAALVSSLPEEPLPAVDNDLKWPVGADGIEAAPALLLVAKNPVDIEIKTSLLNAFGVPVIYKVPFRETFTTVLFGMPIHGADLYVPEPMLELAREILIAQPEE